MDQKMLIKIALIGGGLAALYLYLKSSGQWDEWFGGSTFHDTPALLAYCHANPNGSATFIDPQGVAHTNTCAAWLQANGTSTTSTPTGTTTGGGAPNTSTFAAGTAPMVDRLRAWAIANAILGSDSANIDQWNYGIQELAPGTAALDNGSVGITRGVNDVVNAAKYMELRRQGGLGAYGPPIADVVNMPSWVV